MGWIWNSPFPFIATALLGAAIGGGLFLASPLILLALTIVAVGVTFYFWSTAGHYGAAMLALLTAGCFLIPMWLAWAFLQCTHCG